MRVPKPVIVFTLFLLGCLIGENLRGFQPPQDPVRRNPPTHVNVILREPDYRAMTRAFNAAVKSNEGLMVVRLRTEDARLLMLTLHNATQGTMTQEEKKAFLKAQDEYFRNLNKFQ